MAELYKRGNIWWAWGYDRHGTRWQRTTKQRDKTAARTVAAKIEQELALDANTTKNEACTLFDAVEAMIDHAERAGRAEDTIEFLETKSKHLLRLLGPGKRVARITLGDTTEYARVRTSEGAARPTIAQEIGRLIQSLRRASKMGMVRLEIDPSMLMPDELVGAYVPRDRWLPLDEYAALLAEFNPGSTGRPRIDDRRDYIATWCQTGMREGELYRLLPEHCLFDRKIVRVPGTKTENAKRPVPMTPAVEAILRRRVEAIAGEHGARLFPRWGHVQRDLYAACLRIEVRNNPDWEGIGPEFANRPKSDRVRPPVPFDPVTPNDLRRTFASWLAQAGVPLYDASKLMGHASTKMLERVYAQLAPETLRAAIDRLPAQVTLVAGYGTATTVTGAVTATPENSCFQTTTQACEWSAQPHGTTREPSKFATFCCNGQ